MQSDNLDKNSVVFGFMEWSENQDEYIKQTSRVLCLTILVEKD